MTSGASGFSGREESADIASVTRMIHNRARAGDRCQCPFEPVSSAMVPQPQRPRPGQLNALDQATGEGLGRGPEHGSRQQTGSARAGDSELAAFHMTLKGSFSHDLEQDAFQLDWTRSS